MSRNRLIISAAVGAALLIAGVRALLHDEPAASLNPVGTPETTAMAPTPFSPAPLAADADLRDVLRQEIAAREQLAQTVAQLQQELRDVKAQLGPNPTARSSAQEPAPDSAAATAARAREATPRVDDNALLATGISPLEVKQIRERYEQIEMDRLYLKDRAQREGWSGTVRYSNEVGKIEERRNEIRNNAGEATYDAYLYASGEPNRVLIREMLQGSPAAGAGLQPGDTVLRYADKRVYSTRELQNETKKGKAGENVAVVIERDGQTQTIYIPRGPLGVYLDSESRKP